MSDVSVNIKGLEKFQKELKQINTEAFMEACTKELAARLLAKVKKRTPVGQYKDREGGTLRRGWDQQISVKKEGSNFVCTIINPTEYASYVEYGHRTANHKGWVEGRFMLTISEDELIKDTPRILEQKLKKWLEGVTK